jgi:hypothetical protein
MGERHIPILSGRCHGKRRPDKRFKERRILGEVFLPGWDHARQQNLQRLRMQQSGGLENKISFGDRGRNQSGGLESSCSNKSNAETELLPFDCGVR